MLNCIGLATSPVIEMSSARLGLRGQGKRGRETAIPRGESWQQFSLDFWVKVRALHGVDAR